MTNKKKCIILVLTASVVTIFGILCGGCRIRRPEAQSADIPCVHKWDVGEVTREATCIREGELIKTCLKCKATQTESLEMVAHTEESTEMQAPTCEETGLTAGSKCSVCHITISGREIIPPLGHTVVVDEQAAPTCALSGKTEGAHCSECGKVLMAQEDIPTLPHDLISVSAYSATCDTSGYTGGECCANCGYAVTGEVIPALGHLWSDWTYTQGGCDEERYGLHTCLRESCGKKEAVTVAPIGHAWNEGHVSQAPTCEKTGILVKECTNTGCGELWADILPALGHDYVNGKCSVCGAAQSKEVDV